MAQGVGETMQPPIEKAASFLHIVIARHRRGQRLGFFGHVGFRQQIAVELLVVSGSIDPDVAGSQASAQDGERRDFILAAIDFALFDNEALPGFRQERRWRPFGHRPARFRIQPLQQLDRGEQRVLVGGSPKRETLKERRREPANGHIPVACLDERIFVGLLSEFGGRWPSGKQMFPAKSPKGRQCGRRRHG